mgnify:CR=1 FL=1
MFTKKIKLKLKLELQYNSPVILTFFLLSMLVPVSYTHLTLPTIA